MLNNLLGLIFRMSYLKHIMIGGILQICTVSWENIANLYLHIVNIFAISSSNSMVENCIYPLLTHSMVSAFLYCIILRCTANV